MEWSSPTEQAPVAMTVYGPSNPCSERRIVPMLPAPTFSAAIHGLYRFFLVSALSGFETTPPVGVVYRGAIAKSRNDLKKNGQNCNVQKGNVAGWNRGGILLMHTWWGIITITLSSASLTSKRIASWDRGLLL